MAEIQITIAGIGYRVFIGSDLYERELVDFLAREEGDKQVVVSHPRIMRLHGRRLLGALQHAGGAGQEIGLFTFSEGEASKTLQTLEKGYHFLLDREVSREDMILAFGGGVVGDLAGYLASSYLRGVDYIQIPTTLMAMVDSSIGGKVGVDLPGAKNAVGAFYQPRAVFCAIEVLHTLSQRELRSGLAEVAKYGFVYDPTLLSSMEALISPQRKKDADIETIVSRCVELKARVVERDERDLSGERAMLNYGHTFGHALESSTGYRLFKHGEAVAMGMIMAARASELVGLAGIGLMDAHLRILRPLLKDRMQLLNKVDLKRAIADMKTDKKRGREVRFVMLEEPQKPRLVSSLPKEAVRRAMQETVASLREV